MCAKLKVVDDANPDVLYQDLLKGLNGKRSMVIGNNTMLLLHDDDAITIRLYSTDVVTVEPGNKITFDTGGYLSATTMDRIKSIASKYGWFVLRKYGQAYLATRIEDTIDRVPLDGAQLSLSWMIEHDTVVKEKAR